MTELTTDSDPSADSERRTRLTWGIIGVLVLVLLAGVCPAACCVTSALPRLLEFRELSGEELHVGVIEGGIFYPVRSRQFSRGGTRLTRIPMQAAQSPESEELALWAMEGRVLLVRGHDGGGWIYSAEIVGKAGPVISALARSLIGSR